jgi:hypothetical protein
MLFGSVRSYHHKQLAQALVADVANVRQLVNRIRVEDVPSSVRRDE